MEKRLTADLNVVANSNLEIQLLDGDLNIIQKLDDEPNDVGGLTSAELKAKFDEGGNIIKKYINETLIPAVLTDDATEESRKQAEAARVAAEQGRVTAEEGRVSAEAARAAAEQARSEAESSRVSAENAREAAEQARADETAGIVARATAQANAAAGSASQAAGSEQIAKDAAGTATGAASSASQSAAAASGSASQAQASAAAAAKSADTATAQANAASESATSAAVSQKSASASESAAKASETAAKAAQTGAETAESNAKDSAEATAADAQASQAAASTATGAASAASTAAEAASGSASQASAAATAAAGSAAGAETASKTAQSWAVGGTNTRPGEDTDNAKYWAKQAEAVVGGDFATKVEAQGYVTAHNQSDAAHSDIREALNGKETAGAAAAVQSNLTAHAGNTTVHVTAEQKTTWDGKAAKALSFTVTLTVAGWSGNAQTISNSNFAASGYAYTVCPSSGSHEAYANAAIYADDVTAAGKMTFHCSEKPTANLTVNILRTEVAA